MTIMYQLQKTFFIAFFSCLIITEVTEARTLRVNNVASLVAGVDGYTTLAAALAAAEPGDTIHIEGSVFPYTGNVTIDKKVVIIGPGYFLSSTPETQFNREAAELDFDIFFATGSEGSVLAGIEQKTGATGYQVNATAYAGNRIIIQADNIYIISCKLFYVGIDVSHDLSNINIQRCFFNPGIITTMGSGSGVIANLSVTNCFFRNDYTATAPARAVINSPVGAQSGWRVSQCTFFNSFSVAATHTAFSFNAFFVTAGNTGTITASPTNSYNNNVMNTNVAVGSIVGGVDGNAVRTEAIGLWFSQAGADTAIDIYFTAATNTSTCPLRDGSFERGMYGGGIPYVASGMFNIPSVYDIQMDAEVGDSFDMIIRARTH